MSRHNPEIEKAFLAATAGAEKADEHEFIEKLQPTILTVETDDTYTTREKLKIFALISSLSNCSAKERMKFVRKTAKALK